LQKSKLRQIFRPWLWCASAVVAFAGFLPVVVFGSPLAELLYVFLLLPFVLSMVLIGTLVLAKKHALPALGAAVVFCAVTALLFKNTTEVQNKARWYLYRQTYQRDVLAEPEQPGQLKHAIWNGWVFAGTETVVYLVHDPRNVLAGPAQSHTGGKFAGIPCSVPSVMRLANQWYAVEFYAGQSWDSCVAKPIGPKKTP
jgi:hypothetical protein